jgi:hypothetical protein
MRTDVSPLQRFRPGESPSSQRDDGWILRSAIIWHQPRATPTSLRDRLVTRHEMIFLFVTQPGYYFVGVPRLWLTPDL